MPERTSARPDWDRLFMTAQTQEGLFTTQQAAESGFSPQLLVHHAHSGRVLRVQRGIYRIAHYPAGTQEDLVAAWLWTDRAGVVSHQTALALHELSDSLPSQIHLTLPSEWRRRRFRVPTDVVLHHADIRADTGTSRWTTKDPGASICASASRNWRSVRSSFLSRRSVGTQRGLTYPDALAGRLRRIVLP